MARVLLILPHLPQRMGAPYLGQQYVAAALLEAGHEVRCLDAAAVRWTGSTADVVAAALDFDPQIIGLTLFTYNALAAYELTGALRQAPGMRAVLVAGGPHTTVRPHEALAHGLDAAIVGEGERALPALADAVEAGRWPAPIPGVCTAEGTTPGGFLEQLDTLPWPLTAYGCYEPSWYVANGTVVPGGMMTSRGCPAKCTFCANHVTGRTFRWRSAADVVGEMRALKERWGVGHFSFWDDAFTANRPRLRALCDAMDADPVIRGSTWSCITPANMAREPTLARMAASGCVAVNFGIESGDLATLRSIDKGQRPQHVRDAVAAAHKLGMSTVVNFMFGFPGETVAALQATLDFMAELAPHTEWFNNRGVLVPFPGTPVYERHHVAHGFTDWWLDKRYLADEPNLWALDPRDVQSWLAHDPTLDLGFFPYPPEVRDQIAACVRFKADHNAATVARLQAGQGALQQARTALAS